MCAKLSWVSKIHEMQSQKQSMAGLTILVEKNKELLRTMAAEEPKILVGGLCRFCRVWRE